MLTCRGCGAPRAMGERICKQCRTDHETGARVEVHPPRAGLGRARPLEAPSALAVGWTRFVRRVEAEDSAGWKRRAALGLVPGLGHVFSGERVLAAVFVAAIAALLWLGGRTSLGPSLQLACMAAAMGVHGFSIYSLTPHSKSEDRGVRIGAALLIQLLVVFVWWPLVSWLVGSRIGTIMVRRGTEGDYASGVAVTATGLALGMVIAFAIVTRVMRRFGREAR